jgi:tetratricopeptide (TPR) repeat protein
VSPRGRTLAFRALALALAPALLMVLELSLRATEPPQAELALPEGWDQVRAIPTDAREQALVPYQDAQGVPRVRTSPTLVQRRFMHPLDYSQRRPEGVFRVFCFGGSATLGVPVEDHPEQTFPGQLEGLLRERGVEAEVLNLGGASFGSDRVVELMEQVVGHDPSALVVYSGNNEFFEYALALHRENEERADTLFERRSGLRTVRLLWRLRDRIRDGGLAEETPQSLEERQRALVRTAVELELARDPGAGPVASGEYLERADSPYRAVMDRYAANLARLVALARGVAPLVLVQVPANLLEPPFEGAHDPGLTIGQVERWRGLVHRAEQARDAGDDAQALTLLDQAISLDPTHARAHHLRGMVHLDRGDSQAGLRDLRNALELDMAPGRPLGAQAEAIASLADPPRVLVVDPSAHFEVHSLAGPTGDLFHDSCHLEPRGYTALAEHIVRGLERAELLPVAEPPSSPGD